MERITLINGMGEDSAWFEKQLEEMIERKKDKFSFEHFIIRDMNIGYCCGCWGCWVKTPGECPLKDDMPLLLKSIIHSDLTIFISPVVMGFASSRIKKVTDRIIPLVHPYIGIVHGECHHKSRYSHYPKLGLVLADRDIDHLEGLDLITNIYTRTAINLKSELAFSIGTNGSTEVFEHEIERI